MNEQTKQPMKKETRILRNAGLALRETASGGDGTPARRVISGYAVRFNERSVTLEDWGEKFTEEIAPEAVTETFLMEQDVKMTLFHNREKLLARCNKGTGSMRLFVDAEGVRFEFECPDTELGRFCAEGVERGDLSGCSFSFIPKDYKLTTERDNETLIRHTAFEWLGEMTIGTDPAYPTTSVDCREIAKKVHQERENNGIIAEKEAQAARERKARACEAMWSTNSIFNQ